MGRIQGQTLVEYLIIIGLAIMALVMMAPAFKRGIQTLVKTTSDQIGTQQNSEQDYDPESIRGHMDSSISASRINNMRTTQEYLTQSNESISSTTINELSTTNTITKSNQGFSAL